MLFIYDLLLPDAGTEHTMHDNSHCALDPLLLPRRGINVLFSH